MTKPHIVVVGAGYAGRSLINRLAARRVDANVTLLDPSESLSERTRWHEHLAYGAPTPRPLSSVLPTGTRHLVTRAVEVDPVAKTLRTQTGQLLRYDHLAATMGGCTRWELPPGVQELALRLEDGSLHPSARSVAVIGAGLTGIEVAAELAQARRDLTVHLISSKFGAGLSPGARAYAQAALTRMGVQLKTETRVQCARHGRLVFEASEALEVDAVIWCAGVTPSPLPTQAALPLDELGRVEVDPHLRVPGFSGLWCAGDQARLDMNNGVPLRAACAIAMPMGTHAGDNLARAVKGAPTTPFSMHTPFLCVSLGRRDGIVQHLGDMDVATRRYWTGRRAAWLKERILRATLWLPRAEGRLHMPLYRWLGAPLSAPPRALTQELEP